LIKKDNILLLGGFNVRTTTNRAIVLSNDSNHNPLCLGEDLVLASRYNRNSEKLVENSEKLVENLFGTGLIKICSSQYLIS
jgi:hypothetical protein